MDSKDFIALLECPICFEPFSTADPTTLPCGHTCCIDDAYELDTCFACRAVVPSLSDLCVNYLLRALAVSLGATDLKSSACAQVTTESRSVTMTTNRRKRNARLKSSQRGQRTEGTVRVVCMKSPAVQSIWSSTLNFRGIEDILVTAILVSLCFLCLTVIHI